MVSKPTRPLGIDESHSIVESPPAIAALFVISFDIRAGLVLHLSLGIAALKLRNILLKICDNRYEVSWKRIAPGGEQSTI